MCVEGALVKFSRNASAYDEQDQSKRAADGGAGTITRTNHVAASVHPNPADYGAIDHN